MKPLSVATKKSTATAGRKKLESLGLALPKIPMCAASNLPKQTELMELRYRVSKGIQQGSELDRKEKLSTEVWIRQQEKIGLDILVDGEMNRGDMVQYFSKKIGGFEECGTVRVYGNRFYRKPVVRGKIEWKGPIMSEMWKYAQRLSHKPIKAVLTTPYTLMDWSFNEFYDSREALVRDLTAVLRKEITALAESGVKVLQLDELSIASNPEEFPLILESIKELTRDIKAYVILRLGFGNIEPVWKKMQQLPVDNFQFEAANSHYSFLSTLKKQPTEKDVTIGLVDSHNRDVETPRDLTLRLKKILAAVPASRLWISSDSGLKTRTIEESINKLSAMAQAVIKQRALLK